jgi:acetolactate synthase-1/2/3 large subunit
VSTPPTSVTGGRVIADWMERRGITHFFNVPGESFLPVLDALRDSKSVRTITNRHEAGAAFAAEAYGKLTRRPAVCMATRGPGASNLTIGVQTALYDATPLLALVGMVPTNTQASRAFQDFELPMMFGSIAKRAFMVNERHSLGAALEQAYELSVEGRPGPVVLGLPLDVIYSTTSGSDLPTRQMSMVRDTSAVAGSRTIIDLLRTAARPALLIATEAERGDAAALLSSFSLRTGVPVYAAWRRYSAFDNGHPHFIGSLGLGGSLVVSSSLAEADVVIAFGFGLEQITIQTGRLDRPDVRIVQVAPRHDVDGPRHAAHASVVQVEHEPRVVAQTLIDWCDAHPDEVKALHARVAAKTIDLAVRARTLPAPAGGSGRTHLDVLMHRLNSSIESNAIVSSDAGNFAQWLLRYISFDRARSYIGPINGSMGYGLPGSIGAKLAMPNRPSWCIAGDGGMLMLAGEMETATRLQLNITAVVVNNMSYGTIRARQENEFPDRVAGTSLGEVDFSMLGRAMGWASWRISSDNDIDAVLAEAATAPGCRLIEVLVEQLPFSLP